MYPHFLICGVTLGRKPLLGLPGGLSPNLFGVSLNFCLPYWKSRNFTCSEKWLPEKYISDDSLNVLRIRGGVKYEIKKCGPPYTCLGPFLGLPTHKNLAPPLIDKTWRFRYTCKILCAIWISVDSSLRKSHQTRPSFELFKKTTRPAAKFDVFVQTDRLFQVNKPNACSHVVCGVVSIKRLWKYRLYVVCM